MYESGVRKRGLPQGYVRVLEMLLGSIFSSLEDSEEIMRKLLDRLCLDSEAEWRLTVLERWKSSTLIKEIERLLPTLDVPDERDVINRGLKRSESVSADRNRVAESSSASWRLPSANLLELEVPVMSNNSANHFFVKPSSAVDINQLQQTFPALEVFPGVSYQESPGNGIRSPNDISETTQMTSLLSIENSSLLRLNLPVKAWQLFDIFFAYTNSWLCSINKVDILRIAYKYSAQPLELSRNATGTGTHAALWAVLACASRQASTNTSVSPQTQSLSDSDWTADRLYDAARRLIPEEGAQYETGHVQALLLLSLCNIGTGQWSAAWLLLGHAVRIALVLDLQHVTETQPRHTSESQERRKHVFLGCFILDTLIAAQMGKLPHLRTEIVQRVGFIPENDLEEWDPWLAPLESTVHSVNDHSQRRPTHAGSTFNQLVKIICILNDVICLSPYTSFSREQYQAFSQSLEQWKNELPGHCHVGTTLENITSISACPLPHILGLHLFYLTTYSFLDLRMPQGTELASEAVFGNRLTTVIVRIFQCFEMFGILAVPPVYTIAAQVVLQHAEVFSNPENDGSCVELIETRSKLNRLWSGSAADDGSLKRSHPHSIQITRSTPDNLNMAENPRIATGTPSQQPNIVHFNSQYGLVDYANQTASGSGGLSSRLDRPSLWNQSIDTTAPMMNMSSMLQGSIENDMSISAFDSLPDPGLHLLASEEIDSLLDELGALDSNEMADRQSQFLRNFGFGPDVWQQETPNLNTGR